MAVCFWEESRNFTLGSTFRMILIPFLSQLGFITLPFSLVH